MTVPIIRALTNQHPDCKITVVSKPFLKPLFVGLKNVSFFAADVNKKHKGVFGLYRLFKELNPKRITHIADFHNVLRSKILRTFFKFYGKPIEFIDKGRTEKKALTRLENKIFKQLKTSHQRYADVLAKLNFEIDISNPKEVKQKPLSKKLNSLFGNKENKWIGIAPFAAFKGKVYPLILMEKVINKLSSEGHQIYLFGGGQKEIETLHSLEKKYSNTKSVAGHISFSDELEFISHLDLMISMDSGNAHLAAMKGIKTITLWGVTHPYAGFAPFNQPEDFCLLPDLEKYPKIPCSVYGNKVFDGYENVMETITPEKIIDTVMTVLKE